MIKMIRIILLFVCLVLTLNNLILTHVQNSLIKIRIFKPEDNCKIYWDSIVQPKKHRKISNQYHKNFTELSIEIKKRYKDLGYINSGFISEIKDIFN